MECKKCGSIETEEENGLMYCIHCNVQRKGFTKMSGQTFVDRRKVYLKEVKIFKSKIKPKKERGIMWTTTEAFSLILYNQMNSICEVYAKELNINEFKHFTTIIWSTYLCKSGLCLTEGELHNKDTKRVLHPGMRYRDRHVFSNNGVNQLPLYSNGSTQLGSNYVYKLGSDRVIRTVEELEKLKDFDLNQNKDQNNSDLFDVFDVFSDHYRDPRISYKSKSYEIKISKECRNQLKKELLELDLKKSFEETIDLMETNEDNNELNENNDSNEVTNELNESTSNANMDNKSQNEHNFDDFDKQLITNSSETTKLYSKYIPLSYLKSTQNISSNYFTELMSLPKTLAILNIAFRLLSSQIYLFDLIRWVIEDHIPYNNCIQCLPNDWHFLCNDFQTFTSLCIPSSKTISTLSAQIMRLNGMKSIPTPDLEVLLNRFIKDLNLPKELVSIIQQNYNLMELFPNKLQGMAINCCKMRSIPLYERWVLMVIVFALKRIFILNDSTEKRLSRSANNVNNVFIWEEWEKYTKLRLELIRSYYIPIYSGTLEDIRDVQLISDHSLKRSEYETNTTIDCKRKALFKTYEFRTDTRLSFNELLFDKNRVNSRPELKSSLYPITNATDFALKRLDCSAINDLLSTSFEDKLISPWICSHGNTFHRGYEFLNKDVNQWSNSFKLLIDLSVIILNTKYDNLIQIFNQLEKKNFGSKAQ